MTALRENDYWLSFRFPTFPTRYACLLQVSRATRPISSILARSLLFCLKELLIVELFVGYWSGAVLSISYQAIEALDKHRPWIACPRTFRVD